MFGGSTILLLLRSGGAPPTPVPFSLTLVIMVPVSLAAMGGGFDAGGPGEVFAGRGEFSAFDVDGDFSDVYAAAVDSGGDAYAADP